MRVDDYDPPCKTHPDMFFSPEEDGRKEVGRYQRELKCRAMCFRCKIRIECLYVAITNDHVDGVWGAMGEGERRAFVLFLRSRGVRLPTTQKRFEQEIRRFYARRHSARQEAAS